ncbi:MAG: hypothetical protein IJO46_15390 [Thermoguttaceae bacterium]|nr:hypothetical protein [Thermoguttaceae bacterium]
MDDPMTNPRPNDSASTQAATQNFLNGLNPEDVASVSSAGVSVQFRSPKEKLEAERLKAAQNYNPFAFFDPNDRSLRR